MMGDKNIGYQFSIIPSDNVTAWAKYTGELPLYLDFNGGVDAVFDWIQQVLHRSMAYNGYICGVSLRKLACDGDFVVFKLTADGMKEFDKACKVVQEIWQGYSRLFTWKRETCELIENSFFVYFGHFIGATLEKALGVHTEEMLNVLRNRVVADCVADKGLEITFLEAVPSDTAALLSLVGQVGMSHHCPISKIVFHNSHKSREGE